MVQSENCIRILNPRKRIICFVTLTFSWGPKQTILRDIALTTVLFNYLYKLDSNYFPLAAALGFGFLRLASI